MSEPHDEDEAATEHHWDHSSVTGRRWEPVTPAEGETDLDWLENRQIDGWPTRLSAGGDLGDGAVRHLGGLSNGAKRETVGDGLADGGVPSGHVFPRSLGVLGDFDEAGSVHAHDRTLSGHRRQLSEQGEDSPHSGGTAEEVPRG